MDKVIIPSIISIENNCRKCNKIIFMKDNVSLSPFFVYEEDNDKYKVLIYKGIQTFEIKKYDNNIHIVEDEKVIQLLSNEHNSFILNNLENSDSFNRLITMNNVDVNSIFVNFKVKKNSC